MGDALLVLRTKTAAHGGVVEMVVWRVPTPVPPSQHPFKYRLVFGRQGMRIVDFDNERGKGDHKHRRGQESAYAFANIETLIADFLADVEANR